MAKTCKTRKGKQQIRIESNQSRSDGSGAKGGMDMDRTGRQDGEACDEVD